MLGVNWGTDSRPPLAQSAVYFLYITTHLHGPHSPSVFPPQTTVICKDSNHNSMMNKLSRLMFVVYTSIPKVEMRIKEDVTSPDFNFVKVYYFITCKTVLEIIFSPSVSCRSLGCY